MNVLQDYRFKARIKAADRQLVVERTISDLVVFNPSSMTTWSLLNVHIVVFN